MNGQVSLCCPSSVGNQLGRVARVVEGQMPSCTRRQGMNDYFRMCGVQVLLAVPSLAYQGSDGRLRDLTGIPEPVAEG